MARKMALAEKPASLPATEREPTEAEQAEIRALAKRKKTRRRAPRFKVHQQENNLVQMMPAGVHADAAGARMMNAFGITNLDLAERLMMQIIAATHLQSSTDPVSAETLNAALAAVTGIAPRDEAEAMLAAQMVGGPLACHGSAAQGQRLRSAQRRGHLAVKLRRSRSHIENLIETSWQSAEACIATLVEPEEALRVAS